MKRIQKLVISPILVLFLVVGQLGCDTRTSEAPHPVEDDHGHAHDHGHTHSHDHGQDPAPEAAAERRVRVAMAELEPTEGNEARGTVTFTQTDDGILVSVSVQGVPGPGKRGFHIHEFGDCSAPDATSAGGHFNPTEMPHGAPDDDERHAGDFGNLEVDEEGNAEIEFLDTHISFYGPTSIIGRAVIVHAEEDDLETQPTGDAGARVACGVIEAVEFDD